MKVDGRCHCGAIAYEAVVDPEMVELCHCSDCQTLSGSAFRVVVPTVAGTFRLLSGAPKTYVKTAESRNRRVQAFCPDCGTPLYSAPFGGNGDAVTLRVGAIRQRDDLPPRRQYWMRSAQAWVQYLETLPACEKQ